MSNIEDLKEFNPRTSIAPFDNPGLLGLSAFALVTFGLSLFSAGVPSGGPIQVVTGHAVFYGGVIQIFVGMLEFKIGNDFGATTFA
ncbi:hypothetical protein BGZ49_003682 [Haplosporangium sp. Z 27]|nr:hypothetical protein BGZ49_003682 [Haplosporangium sp. Z 27]